MVRQPVVELVAPGAPGAPAHWALARKSGVGTAATGASRVWFSLAEGRVTETFFPRPDLACTRRLRLFVADGPRVVELGPETCTSTSPVEPGVPSFRVVHIGNGARVEVSVATHPQLDVLLVRIAAKPSSRVFAVLESHLANRGAANVAELHDRHGEPMIVAHREHVAIALAARPPLLSRSVGYVGASDSVREILEHARLAPFTRASGHVVLAAELAPQATLVLAYGRDVGDATHLAAAGLIGDIGAAIREYEDEWRAVHEGDRDPLSCTSRAVLRTFHAKRPIGGAVASLATPWGTARPDEADGTYHVAWTRDVVECASGLLAARQLAHVHQTLVFLATTQREDGGWPQNMWLDGEAHWQGGELDEIALPILLAGLARREGAFGDDERDVAWNMMAPAAAAIVRRGPSTDEDRWEDASGYTPFTLGAQIAALIEASAWAEHGGERSFADLLRSVADDWNESIERWIWSSGDALSRRCGVSGHYRRVRAAAGDERQPTRGERADRVSPDALALVRFGLRDARDPRIESTLAVIDATLRVELPTGPAWRRYLGDRYGEHEDGAPFEKDRPGIGRAWPLLTGERAHYALARGHVEEARRLLATLESFATEQGYFAEQLWDAPDLPQRGLRFAQPTFSATPLGWAHAEHLKLKRSLADGHVFDLPPLSFARYVERRTPPTHAIWKANHRRRAIARGRTLRIVLDHPTVVAWSVDRVGRERTESRAVGRGLHVVDVGTGRAPEGTCVRFVLDGEEHVVSIV